MECSDGSSVGAWRGERSGESTGEVMLCAQVAGNLGS